MKFRENDIIVSIVDISPIIRKGTRLYELYNVWKQDLG